LLKQLLLKQLLLKPLKNQAVTDRVRFALNPGTIPKGAIEFPKLYGNAEIDPG
jgi:hypothetical protein